MVQTIERYVPSALADGALGSGALKLPQTRTRDAKGNLDGESSRLLDFAFLAAVDESVNVVTHYEYDLVGNPTSQGHAGSIPTRYRYDESNRLVHVADPTGIEVDYRYDAVGNLIALSSSSGTNVRFAYDAMDELSRITDTLGREVPLPSVLLETGVFEQTCKPGQPCVLPSPVPEPGTPALPDAETPSPPGTPQPQDEETPSPPTTPQPPVTPIPLSPHLENPQLLVPMEFGLTWADIANGWDSLGEHQIGGVRFLYGTADTVVVETAEGVVVISSFGWSYVFDGGETRSQTHEALRETGDYLFNHLAAAYVGEIEQLVFSDPANNCDANPMVCILLVQELARQQADQVKRETGEAAWAATQAAWEECRADGWECSGRSTGVIIDLILGAKGAKRLLGLTDEAAGAGGVVSVVGDIPGVSGYPTGAAICLTSHIDEAVEMVEEGWLLTYNGVWTRQMGPLWAWGWDRYYGRMTLEQLEYWSRRANVTETIIAIPGGFAETRFGALFREHLWNKFEEFQRLKLTRQEGDKWVSTPDGLRLEALIQEEYGIDFPAWRFTGAPLSNTPLDSAADIDIYIPGLDPEAPIPPAIVEGIENIFGPLESAPDNYSRYWREIPPGSVVFLPDGTIYRTPSAWDNIDNLSPKGRRVFEEWLLGWIDQQNQP